MKKNCLLFDFDGTVIDNSEGIYNCIRYALDRMGTPVPDAAVLRTFVGPSLYDSYMNKCEADPARAELFVKLYRERYAPVGKFEVRLYPGMADLLGKLHADGRRLAVCSSKPREFVTAIAKHLQIYDLFEFYGCPGFSEKDSDKTSLIAACLRHFGAEKEAALMIGDTKYDILAAQNAGVASLGVRYGFSAPGELEAAGADWIADDPAQMYEVISRL